MTLGIDVARYQSGIDYAQARAEGVEFVIVKASGFNTGTLYVAGGYVNHINAARAAGMPGIGHYYVPGAGDPVAQANYFVDNLHGFDSAHDLLALDNEPLDSNRVYWQQDQALAFLAQVQTRTGIPWNRLVLYCPASLTRSQGPWESITNAGIRIWWAAYGQGPTGHTPDHTPALRGKIARWDIHQYSSSVKIAGHTVDGNFTPLSVGDLFGGAAAATPAPSVPATVPGPPQGGSVGPILRSGRDWAIRLPTGDLAKYVVRGLQSKGRLPADYPNDGDPQRVFEAAVQKTLNFSNIFHGLEDGRLERGGAYGIQDYAIRFGDYTQNGGIRDGRPEGISWRCFGLGVTRP